MILESLDKLMKNFLFHGKSYIFFGSQGKYKAINLICFTSENKNLLLTFTNALYKSEWKLQLFQR